MATVEGGFPHSEIHGSKPVRGSPWLIAAYHVLHRLSAPRHPPDTLKTLDRSHYRCPSRPRPKGAASTAPTFRHRRRRCHKDLCFRTCPGWEAVKASHRHAPRSPGPTAARLTTPRGEPRKHGVESTRRFGPHARLRLSCVPKADRPDTFTLHDVEQHAPSRRGDAPAGGAGGEFWYADEGCSEAVPIGPSRLAPPPKRWWSKTGSNRRPHACKARALPTELLPLRRKLALSTEGQPSASNAGADFRRLGSRHGARRPVGLADAGRVGQRRHADWWAWEDSNFRPHAYQARALTN